MGHLLLQDCGNGEMLGTRQPVSHTQQNNTRKITSQRLLDHLSRTPYFRLEDCKKEKEKKKSEDSLTSLTF